MKRTAGPRGRLLAGSSAFYKQRSSALVIVLGCLAIITILIVALLASVSSERQSAQFYANGSSVKLLADSTVSIVMGQIKDATKGLDSNSNMLSWASQPGMIRTYNTSGQAAGYYKLYSWANMTSSGSFNPSSSSEMPPSSWASMPALYTDLNDPVSGVYPIVDPAATASVQGFSITGAPTSPTDAAPMPVQWLYVLQDGSVAPATGAAGNTVTVANASATNSIVGRIAFWADDDTCKININTAAGDVWTSSSAAPGQPGNPGSFWDIPRTANQTFELNILSKNQPAQDEYQRYPGHPATTYLSAVFPTLTTTNIDQIIPRVALGGSYSGTTSATSRVTPDSDRLYSSIDELLFDTNRVNQPNLPSGTTAFTAQAIEQAKFFLTAHSRAPEVNLFNRPRVVIWPVSVKNDNTHRTAYDSLIAYCGALVCTNALSGALNTNAYYFQRDVENAIGASTTTGADSATDDLPVSAAATGLGRNRSLITYLRNLTSLPVPGFSTNSETFVSKYPMDRDEILTEIFDYIRAANSQDSSSSVAGFLTYATTTTSTLTLGVTRQGQIVPIADTVHSDSNTATLRGFGRFPTVREAGLLFVGVGQVQGAITNAMPVGNPYYTTNDIPDGDTRVQALFYLNFFDPSQGYAASVPNFKVRVSQLSGFTWAGTPMGFASSATGTVTQNYNSGNYGGYKGATSFLAGVVPTTANGTTFTAGVPGFFSTPKDFSTTSSTNTITFPFQGGDVKVEILDDTPTGNVLQTLTMNFPNATFPVPYLAPQLQDWAGSIAATNDYRSLTAYNGSLSSTSEPVIGGRFSGATYVTSASTSSKMWICGRDVVRSVVANTDPRLIAAQTNVASSFFSEIEPQYGSPAVGQIHGVAEAENGGGTYFYQGTLPGKLVANASYSGIGAGAPTPWTGSDFYYPGTTYPAINGLQPIANWVGATSSLNVHIGLPGYSVPFAFGMNGSSCTAVNGVTAGSNQISNTANYTASTPPPGDWDSGMGNIGDGAFVNKVDEGNIVGITSGQFPYFNNQVIYSSVGGTFFSPNRQISSPVTFGSLPTGVESNRPWQTLLFRPDPGGTPQHIGAQSPQDHLLLDLFNMPVVEPYAISDPFSTAGKINMNYQIVPFTYITRSTGIQAVLKPEQILALNSTNATSSIGDAWNYKGNMSFANRRNFVDITQTLVGFQNRFNSGDIFRSASEICNIWLVPAGQGLALSSSDSVNATTMRAFWNNYLLTGDNVRERPYSDIYPRLTTKSNTFTVHYRVQLLKKVKSTQVNQWVEGTDVVSAEYRGSSTLERYLDTSDTTIPDYATEPLPIGSDKAIDNFYKFRVIETKQFTP